MQIEFLKKREFNLQLERDCLFAVFNKSVSSKEYSFDCGDYDLNDFFKNDAVNYAEQLLGRSYYFECKASKDIVSFSFLFKDEFVEKMYNSINANEQLKTRLMYFGLITLL